MNLNVAFLDYELPTNINSAQSFYMDPKFNVGVPPRVHSQSEVIASTQFDTPDKLSCPDPMQHPTHIGENPQNTGDNSQYGLYYQQPYYLDANDSKQCYVISADDNSPYYESNHSRSKSDIPAMFPFVQLPNMVDQYRGFTDNQVMVHDFVPPAAQNDDDPSFNKYQIADDLQHSHKSLNSSSDRSSRIIYKRRIYRHAIHKYTACSNCGTEKTSLWRRSSNGEPLCNACGLFRKLHGSNRPISLKTDVIRKRNRSRNGAVKRIVPIQTNALQSYPRSLKHSTPRSPSQSQQNKQLDDNHEEDVTFTCDTQNNSNHHQFVQSTSNLVNADPLDDSLFSQNKTNGSLDNSSRDQQQTQDHKLYISRKYSTPPDQQKTKDVIDSDVFSIDQVSCYSLPTDSMGAKPISIDYWNNSPHNSRNFAFSSGPDDSKSESFLSDVVDMQREYSNNPVDPNNSRLQHPVPNPEYIQNNTYGIINIPQREFTSIPPSDNLHYINCNMRPMMMRFSPKPSSHRRSMSSGYFTRNMSNPISNPYYPSHGNKFNPPVGAKDAQSILIMPLYNNSACAPESVHASVHSQASNPIDNSSNISGLSLEADATLHYKNKSNYDLQ